MDIKLNMLSVNNYMIYNLREWSLQRVRQRRFKSACESAHSDQIFHRAPEENLDPWLQ